MTYVGNFVNDFRIPSQAMVTRAVRLAWFCDKTADVDIFVGSTSQSSSLYSSSRLWTNGMRALRRYYKRRERERGMSNTGGY